MTETTTTTTETITGTVIDDESAQKIAEALNRVRPIDPEQKQNLQQILNVDFQGLSADLSVAYQTRLREVEEKVRAESTLEEEIAQLKAEAEAAVKRYQKTRKRLRRAGIKADIQVEMPDLGYGAEDDYDSSFEVNDGVGVYSQALARQIHQAQQPVHEAYQTAQHLLADQRRKADRQVLVASVSQDAADVLAQLPTKDDLLAAFAQALPAIES